MKRLFLAAASVLAALVLPGCLQSETTIHLNKDGSGTLVEQTTLGAQALAMMEQMAAGFGGGGEAKDPLADMFSMEKAKARAATLGEGVTVEKSVPFESEGNKGARTTYRFADINKLKVAPGDSMKDVAPPMPGQPAAPKQKPVSFAYTGGTLTVTMPEPEKPAADAPEPPQGPDLEGNPQMEAMMKQMLGDMKMSFKLVIEPGIAETDASFSEGNTITLMSMDMGKLLEKPDTLKKLNSAPKNDPAAAMELFKGIEGMKAETKKQVTVKVK
jgi:hypothetical protein